MDIDKSILNDANLQKLEALGNSKVMSVVEKYVKLCKPKKVTVITDSAEDIDYIRYLAIQNGEEKPLEIEGHTIHFDSMVDQGRDKANTKILLPHGKFLGKHINSTDRDEGLKEVHEILDGIMEGKEMLVRFFCLGPIDSKFSISALQLTDSAYVCHSEDILYRKGYEQFKKIGASPNFFYFVHSAGELDERNNTKNIEQRRIYIDLEEERVVTVNNQYAGNSVGLKKLALRLAISRAAREEWLCEHMFVMGVHPKDSDRVTYFAGAFPSACGKTSTAMISGQTIIGDDIAYIKLDDEGKPRAANVEQGIFGIIQDVNPNDDPVIYDALTKPGEVIFSNVLIKDGKPFWLGMGSEIPESGENFSGAWTKGKTDANGNEILPAHKNARYTLRINELENADPNVDSPDGVVLDGIIYGGRDSDTSVPVCQSPSWAHGVFVGATLESETTAATLGAEGLRKHNPMANLDFLVIPFGEYIENHLKFAEVADKVPLVFSTNYFQKDENGKFMTGMLDKKVWLMWMEGRVHGDFDAIETPVGLIPKHEDLRDLFSEYLGKEYSEEAYIKQFSIKVSKQLARLERIEQIFFDEENIPEVFMKHIEQQGQRLKDTKDEHGTDVISPLAFL